MPINIVHMDVGSVSPEAITAQKQQEVRQSADILLLKKAQNVAKDTAEQIIEMISDSVIDFKA